MKSTYTPDKIERVIYPFSTCNFATKPSPSKKKWQIDHTFLDARADSTGGTNHVGNYSNACASRFLRTLFLLCPSLYQFATKIFVHHSLSLRPQQAVHSRRVNICAGHGVYLEWVGRHAWISMLACTLRPAHLLYTIWVSGSGQLTPKIFSTLNPLVPWVRNAIRTQLNTSEAAGWLPVTKQILSARV